jgi:phospholipid/cholesterol/gamma-HCH transport system substrate-binding protein
MSAKSSNFLIGLFVITGVLICAAIIIWVGASRVFMKGSLYSVYFDESVRGLQVDSAIKYRGVDIGKVQSIDVAPDYRLIEVVMKIELEGDLPKQTIAVIKSAGITGIVFIELDRIMDGELVNSPKITFKSKYPVIPSRRSEMSRFLADTDTIMQNVKEVDFKGISDQLKNTARAIENLTDNKKIDNILLNLESTSANLNQAITRINKTISEGKVDKTLNEAMGVLSDARQLIGQAKKEVESLNLKEKSSRTNILLDDIDKKTKAITNELQDTSEHLRVTSENLERLSDNLKKNPSNLIFSKPAPPKKAME